MSHYGNKYYILVGFCAKTGHVIIILILSGCLLLSIQMVNFKLATAK